MWKKAQYVWVWSAIHRCADMHAQPQSHIKTSAHLHAWWRRPVGERKKRAHTHTHKNRTLFKLGVDLSFSSKPKWQTRFSIWIENEMSTMQPMVEKMPTLGTENENKKHSMACVCPRIICVLNYSIDWMNKSTKKQWQQLHSFADFVCVCVPLVNFVTVNSSAFRSFQSPIQCARIHKENTLHTGERSSCSRTPKSMAPATGHGGRIKRWIACANKHRHRSSFVVDVVIEVGTRNIRKNG